VEEQEIEWISTVLDTFPFVQWDRFTHFKNIVRVYGWIDREKDEYKDFVHFEFNLEHQDILFLGTSSDKYSERINEILNEILDEENGHTPCQRVENQFDVENSIQLGGESE